MKVQVSYFTYLTLYFSISVSHRILARDWDNSGQAIARHEWILRHYVNATIMIITTVHLKKLHTIDTI